jgi:hypothetical protein
MNKSRETISLSYGDTRAPPTAYGGKVSYSRAALIPPIFPLSAYPSWRYKNAKLGPQKS